ncbi:hypothetical protein [Mycobacterium hubeiense]|uniref:hypothetical protein n=1 Tax=Mycobacterium hubeiense TaxID=1867256 RepID=UPI000C7F09CD|nr:hypothetical protein [Mycobacterium sp. QGD 101]
MQPSRRRSGSTGRRAPKHDAEIVRKFTDDITAACIDLVDLPLDISAQKRVIELLLNDAPAADQAVIRLHNAAVNH